MPIEAISRLSSVVESRRAVAHLDSTTHLSREIASMGIYPAVDPLTSTSRILDPRYISAEHYNTATRVKQILQRNKELQDIIAIPVSYTHLTLPTIYSV